MSIYSIPIQKLILTNFNTYHSFFFFLQISTKQTTLILAISTLSIHQIYVRSFIKSHSWTGSYYLIDQSIKVNSHSTHPLQLQIQNHMLFTAQIFNQLIGMILQHSEDKWSVASFNVPMICMGDKTDAWPAIFFNRCEILHALQVSR